MKGLTGDVRIAVVGATGTVGGQIVELLSERELARSELKVFGFDAAARGIEAGGRTLPVARFESAEDLRGFDVAFLAIGRKPAGEIIQLSPGPTLIDLSAATVLPDIAGPLVAPGLTTREKLTELPRANRFGVPHPAAQVIAVVLTAIGNRGFAGGAILISASAGGHQGIAQLFQQSADLLNARLDLSDEQTQLAFNVFPTLDARGEAALIAAQVDALSGAPSGLALDVVQVPAFHGSAVALFFPARDDCAEWPARLRAAPGLIVVEGADGCGFADAVGQEAVIVRMSEQTAGAALWCVFDAARLAALTAVWIAEALLAP